MRGFPSNASPFQRSKRELFRDAASRLVASHDGFVIAAARENPQHEQCVGRQFVGNDDAPPERQDPQAWPQIRPLDADKRGLAEVATRLPDVLDVGPRAAWIVGGDEIEDLVEVSLRFAGKDQRPRHDRRGFSASASRASKWRPSSSSVTRRGSSAAS